MNDNNWNSQLRKLRNRFRSLRNDRILRTAARDKRPLKLVVGSGGKRISGWLLSDRDNIDLTDRSTWLKYFKPNELEAILAEHVWEHLDPDDALTAAKNCYEFLRPGAYLRVAVPDGYHPSETYIDNVRPGGTGSGSDDHRALYNYQTLSKVFQSAGFGVVLLEYFDEEGSFHASPWDSSKGHIDRSSRFDSRNKAGRLNYTSIILDAIKPTDAQVAQLFTQR